LSDKIFKVNKPVILDSNFASSKATWRTPPNICKQTKKHAKHNTDRVKVLHPTRQFRKPLTKSS